MSECEGTNAYGGKCQHEARFRVTIGRRTVVYICGRHLAAACSTPDSSMFTVDRLSDEGGR